MQRPCLCRGIDLRLPSGRQQHYVPLTVSHNADKLEQANVGGLFNWPNAYSDLNSLCHQDDFGDPDVVLTVRTEEGMREVRAIAWPLPLLAAWS